MRAAVLVAFAIAAHGCIDSRLVMCSDGRACPVGTTCAQLAENEAPICAQQDELAACQGLAALADCTTPNGDPGACYESDAGLVCLPRGCGNNLIDRDEICDDGNAIVGDGCSNGCQSNETCGNGIVDPVQIVDGMFTPKEACDDANYVGHDGCANDCQLEVERWERLVVGAPPARFWGAMAYDSARDRVVMFGGAFRASTGATTSNNDTWEWDGSGWMRIPTPVSPLRRHGHVLVYDPVRRRVVLFGGQSSGLDLADTWEWDGTSWQLREPTNVPTARVHATGVFDPTRKRVVIFGGTTTAGVVSDMWEWDGSTWTEIPLVTTPPRRRVYSMAPDPVRGVIVLSGGVAMNPAETWEFDGAQWRAIATTTPAELDSATLAFDGIGVLAYGGMTPTGTHGNTYRWNGTSWTLVVPGSTKPQARANALATYDARRGRVVMFGGFFTATQCTVCDATLADTQSWNGSSWNELTLASPTERSHVAMTYDSQRGRTIMFGGSVMFNNPTATAETWELAGTSWRLYAGTGPTARSAAGIAYDAARRTTVLFGGRTSNGTGAFADTWLWNGAMWTLVAPTASPPARHSHMMAFDPRRNRIVLHGGYTAGFQPLNDTWEWDGVTWRDVSVVMGPAPRSFAAFVYHPLRERVVMFGGETLASLSLADTWEWDGTTWTQTTTMRRPPSRARGAFGWNGARRSALLFGGDASVFSMFDDAWELDDDWTQLFSLTPSARTAPGTSATRAGDGLLVFGGMGNGALTTELWRWRWQSTSAYELCTLDADNDRDGFSGCADPDCWASCTPLCPPGTTCDPSWPHCGDGICSGVEGCRLCPQDCGACSAVCGDNFCDPGETAASCIGDC